MGHTNTRTHSGQSHHQAWVIQTLEHTVPVTSPGMGHTNTRTYSGQSHHQARVIQAPEHTVASHITRHGSYTHKNTQLPITSRGTDQSVGRERHVQVLLIRLELARYSTVLQDAALALTGHFHPETFQYHQISHEVDTVILKLTQ